MNKYEVSPYIMNWPEKAQYFAFAPDSTWMYFTSEPTFVDGEWKGERIAPFWSAGYMSDLRSEDTLVSREEAALYATVRFPRLPINPYVNSFESEFYNGDVERDIAAWKKKHARGLITTFQLMDLYNHAMLDRMSFTDLQLLVVAANELLPLYNSECELANHVIFGVLGI